MLLGGNCFFGGVPKLWPLAERNNRTGNPAQIEGKVMEIAQEDVGRDSPDVEGVEEAAGLMWAILEEVEFEDLFKGSVFFGRF